MIWPAQFAANGYTADLSERFSEEERGEYLPTVIEAMTYEGGIHGVPWYTEAGMLYYRRDLLEESGFSEPPGTWDELKEQAETVQQASGTRYGFISQGADCEGGVVDALECIWTSGGDVLEADEVVIDSPEEQEIETIPGGSAVLCATCRVSLRSPPIPPSRA